MKFDEQLEEVKLNILMRIRLGDIQWNKKKKKKKKKKKCCSTTCVKENNVVMHLGIYEPNNFKSGTMIDAIKLWIFVLVLATLNFIQGHWNARKQNVFANSLTKLFLFNF